MRSTFIHNAILYLTFYTITLVASNQKPYDDAVSLLAFKSVADTGNNLGYSVQNISAFCKWQGVQCQINGKVVRLVLENLNLAGVFAANTLTRMEQLRYLSLQNNSLTGPIPDLAGLVNLKSLFLDHNYFTGSIPASITSLHRLRNLDLSDNKLTGVIPVELCNLDRLNYLRLDSNHLNGSIPPFNQSSLQIFNVSDNFLTGPVPVTPTLARFGPALFSINGRLCGVIVRVECGISGQFFGKNSSSSSTPPWVGRGKSGELQPMEGFTNSNSTKHKRIVLLVGFSGGLLVVITLVVCIILSIKTLENKRRRKGIVPTREIIEMAEAAEVMRREEGGDLAMEKKKVRKLHQGMGMEKSGNLVFFTGESQLFTVDHLMRAPAELLGIGTFGTTYKALLDNRVIMSVKRLDASRLEGTTNEAFERQMEVVGRLRHPNLVALRAYFLAEEEKLLVYDYQPNGSLFTLIHGSKSMMAKSLHWTSCLKIAEDVAQGLCYLHQTCSLVHGNLKASNVLLGSDFEACLSDYCLSTLFNGNRVSAAYKKPESESHHPTAKSDVYSFGVLLLELLTGKTASEQPDVTPDDLVKWVKSNRDNGGGGMEMEEKRVEMMTEVAIACSVRTPELSPTMWQVIKMLQEIKEAAVMEDCGLNPWIETS